MKEIRQSPNKELKRTTPSEDAWGAYSLHTNQIPVVVSMKKKKTELEEA
jgi:uncharacterized membrane-anchored protein YitT (DUF2179 family)